MPQLADKAEVELSALVSGVVRCLERLDETRRSTEVLDVVDQLARVADMVGMACQSLVRTLPYRDRVQVQAVLSRFFVCCE